MSKCCQMIIIECQFMETSVDIKYKSGTPDEVRAGYKDYFDELRLRTDVEDASLEIWVNPVDEEHLLSVISEHESKIKEMQYKLDNLTKSQKDLDGYGFSDEQWFECCVQSLTEKITKLKEIMNEDCSSS